MSFSTNGMQNLLITDKSKDYELLDSGDGLKLERYGKMVLSRPDPQALWKRSLTTEEWNRADAKYVRTGQSGKWEVKTDSGAEWSMDLEGISFSLKLLPSKHLGVFPEQSMQWKWLEEKIIASSAIRREGGNISVLNLFGYTGGASLISAKAGADVCHVDSSEFAVDLLKKNMNLSGLQDKPIRLIVDDARKFVEREIKRGNKYNVVIMDPPVYGKGANEEVWNIESDLMPLLSRIREILSAEPVAIILNGYASIYSHLTYKELLDSVTGDLGGSVTSGELAIKQSSSERLLSCGIFARWEK
ncbi:MAG: SAM-dependent methyltransferase [Candidatus Zambryskibacteria bacterium]|nr:SAM-dependent methyltransferase [Candidatus Zambryskibacteria bacterium]